MKKILLLTFLLISHLTLAQRFTIKGQVQDEKGAGLPAATVLLLQPTDSSLVTFGATDLQGNFELKQVAKASYLLKITFLGYDAYFNTVAPPAEGNVLDQGVIKMQLRSNALGEVLVKGEKSPVTIKKDTIEYNAGSFKTQPNAAVQELLKKMPGIEVNSEGEITANGEKVKRVTVEGKEFFGKDPKIATQNLPADAIDKVQVFDKKSDQATFTGIDDGQREKTINLKLKEDKKNSAFGNIMAGVGTEERYQAKASINRFNKGKQLSFLGLANNVGEQGFGFNEFMNFSGGSHNMMSGGRLMISSNNANGVPLNFGGRANGLTNSYAGGVNFNNQLTKKLEANGSYFLNHLNQNISRSVEREYAFPKGTTLESDDNVQQNINTNHRANYSLEYKLDSANSAKVMGNATYSKNSLLENGESVTTGPDGTVLNQGNRNAISEGESYNIDSNILLRHKFATPGRTISSNTQLIKSQIKSEGSLFSSIEYPERPVSIINQTSRQHTDNSTISTTLSYTEPLGNRRYLEANYNFRNNLNDVDREVMDVIGDEVQENELLSNAYNSSYLFHKAGLNLKLNRRKFNITVGSDVQYTSLSGETSYQGSDINRFYQNILPSASFNFDFANNKNLSFNYETLVQEPTIQQLQPVIDNRNPLNLYVGNPDLKPSYAHQWRLNFSTFDPVRFVNFFVMANVNYTRNAIINSLSIDEETFIRTSQPVNVDENMTINAFSNLGFPFKKLNSRFSISANMFQQLGTVRQNDQNFNVDQRTLTGSLRYEYNLKETFSLSLRSSISAQRADYEFAEQQDQLFFNNTYGAETNLRFLKKFYFNSTFDYQVYDNPGQNFRQAIPMLNLSLGRQFLKKDSGELKLSVQNLLDENLGLRQNTEGYLTQREQMNSLGRYLMLSFTYSINKAMSTNAPGNSIRIIR